MASVIEFHPPLTPFSATPNPEDPESYLLNVSFCVQLARDAGTPQGDALYRAFVSEWHALHGQPLSPEAGRGRLARRVREGRLDAQNP